jgi:hypothetical protein
VKRLDYEVASSTALTAVKMAKFSRTELKHGTRVEIEVLDGPHRYHVLSKKDAAPKAGAKFLPCIQVAQFSGRLAFPITT